MGPRSPERQPSRIMTGVGVAIAAIALNVAPAEADHENAGPTINTGSFCDPQLNEASLDLAISNYSGVESNYENGHNLHAQIDDPYGGYFDEILEPGDQWVLGGQSGNASMPAGEVDVTLTWEGHDNGEDYTFTGTLDFPAISCPSEEYIDGDQYFFPDTIENYDEDNPPDTGGPEDPIENVDRLEGDDRYETSTTVAREYFSEANTTLIATGEKPYDALVAGPLAALNDAPLLLNPSDVLSDTVTEELERLNTENVILLGGEAALSAEVEASLNDAGYDTVRFAGGDRYDTARMIADVFPAPSTAESANVWLADGTNFPDALSASAIASKHNEPILLTSPDYLPPATDEYLSDREADIANVIITGGHVAVSQTVEIEAAQASTAEAVRLSGPDRYATSVEIAEYGLAIADEEPEEAYIATGRNFPDALVTGPALAENATSSTFVLVDGLDATASDVSYEYLASLNALNSVYVLGGPGAVTDEVASHAAVSASS